MDKDRIKRALTDAFVAGQMSADIDESFINRLADELTPDASVPDLLKDARIALTFYRQWMSRKEPGTTYPFGIDAEDAARKASS